MFMPFINHFVTKQSQPTSRGRAVGTLTGFTFVGGFLNPIILTPLNDRWGLRGTFIIVSGCSCCSRLAPCPWLFGAHEMWGGRCCEALKQTLQSARICRKVSAVVISADCVLLAANDVLNRKFAPLVDDRRINARAISKDDVGCFVE
jgi:MFS family permease